VKAYWPLAAAVVWSVGLLGLGAEGYLELTRAALSAADTLRAGITAIPGLTVLGEPDSTIVAYAAGAGGPDIYALADRLEARGWAVDRQQRPASVHLTCTANHLAIVEDYLADLRAAAAEVAGDPSLAQGGSAPMYGMMARVPERGLVRSSVRKVLESMYAPGAILPDLSDGTGDGVVGRLLERHGPRIARALDTAERLRARLTRGRRP